MNLPSRANTILYTWPARKVVQLCLSSGTFGCPHTFRSLSSPDATVAEVARAGIVSVIRKRIYADPDLFVLVYYLNGSSTSDFLTICSRACHAAQRLGKKISLEWAASEATDSLVLYVHRRANAIPSPPLRLSSWSGF
ncbi:hypothetical protein TNIN_130801 [Trichonephila inaurata madagascariensis]|uniref:Uncharacterized protein n=1 Tax=Trichonephila inaurata madagascariensis TaxID=2747483 RepID=A0A8X6JN92_9ARAC|nr:hypothetical protein TNIN_130801 [Trichonephila inaurata madagascariensis]